MGIIGLQLCWRNRRPHYIANNANAAHMIEFWGSERLYYAHAILCVTVSWPASSSWETWVSQRWLERSWTWTRRQSRRSSGRWGTRPCPPPPSWIPSPETQSLPREEYWQPPNWSSSSWILTENNLWFLWSQNSKLIFYLFFQNRVRSWIQSVDGHWGPQ